MQSHSLINLYISYRSSRWVVDSHSMSADCHDWSGHCVLCDSRQKYAISVPAYMQWMERAHLHLFWPISLDCDLCHHSDILVNGECSKIF